MKNCLKPAVILLSLAATMLVAAPVHAQSVAETLEKGIYNEETTGNLNEAIRHYKQVLTEAKKTEGLAAQAQFRMGRCLKKLGKKQEANDAFQALIDNYPQQTELVEKARKMLSTHPELAEVPWKSGESLTYTMTLEGGLPIGLIGCAVNAARRDGRDVWEMDVRRYLAGGGNSGVSRAIID